MDTIRYAMSRIELERPSWQTLVVSASKEVAQPAEALWRAFTRLETWPAWSAPLHRATRWLGDPDWVPGATFEQTLQLGFPIGRQVATVTLGAVEPARMVSWWHTDGGLRSCHVWDFDEVSPGRTRVTDTEVFHGLAMGLVKPLVASRWRSLFAGSVAGLERAADQG
jgi:hypothetical protein